MSFQSWPSDSACEVTTVGRTQVGKCEAWRHAQVLTELTTQWQTMRQHDTRTGIGRSYRCEERATEGCEFVGVAVSKQDMERAREANKHDQK